MTLNQLINKLSAYPEDARDKAIKVVAENGLVFDPEIKIILKDRYNVLNHSASNIDFLLYIIKEIN